MTANTRGKTGDRAIEAAGRHAPRSSAYLPVRISLTSPPPSKLPSQLADERLPTCIELGLPVFSDPVDGRSRDPGRRPTSCSTAGFSLSELFHDDPKRSLRDTDVRSARDERTGTSVLQLRRRTIRGTISQRQAGQVIITPDHHPRRRRRNGSARPKRTVSIASSSLLRSSIRRSASSSCARTSCGFRLHSLHHGNDGRARRHSIQPRARWSSACACRHASASPRALRRHWHHDRRARRRASLDYADGAIVGTALVHSAARRRSRRSASKARELSSGTRR